MTDLSVALSTVVRQGPAVGVHAAVSCAGTHTVEQRLGRNARTDFSLRIATDSTTADDLLFTAETHGTVVGPRPHQLLVGDRFTGTTTRVRGYAPLTAADIASLGKDAHGGLREG